jgi:hypothetical protein
MCSLEPVLPQVIWWTTFSMERQAYVHLIQKVPGTHTSQLGDSWHTCLILGMSLKHMIGKRNVPGTHDWYSECPWHTFLMLRMSLTCLVLRMSLKHMLGTQNIPDTHAWYSECPWHTVENKMKIYDLQSPPRTVQYSATQGQEHGILYFGLWTALDSWIYEYTAKV